MYIKARLLGFQPWLYDFLAVWHWARHVNSCALVCFSLKLNSYSTYMLGWLSVK